jgi:hypothetical protein
MHDMPITAAAKKIGIRYDMAFSSLSLIWHRGEANERELVRRFREPQVPRYA